MSVCSLCCVTSSDDGFCFHCADGMIPDIIYLASSPAMYIPLVFALHLTLIMVCIFYMKGGKYVIFVNVVI